MSRRTTKRKAFALLGLMVVLSMVLSACAAPTPVVVEKVVEKPVVQTVVVEKEKVVEKPVVQTVVVEITPTPVPEFSPVLPNTIAWTLTAVPQVSGISYILR